MECNKETGSLGNCEKPGHSPRNVIVQLCTSKYLLLPWKYDGLFDTSVLPVWQIHAHLEAIRERHGGVLEAVLRVAQEGQQILVTFKSRDDIVSKNDGAVSQLGQNGLQSR